MLNLIVLIVNIMDKTMKFRLLILSLLIAVIIFLLTIGFARGVVPSLWGGTAPRAGDQSVTAVNSLITDSSPLVNVAENEQFAGLSFTQRDLMLIAASLGLLLIFVGLGAKVLIAVQSTGDFSEGRS